MIDNRFIEILNDCIERLRRGQTVDDCLRAYPDDADQLAPLLEAGFLVRRAQISSAEVSLSQQRVSYRFEDALNNPPTIRGGGNRFFWILAATLIFLSMLMATSAAAQQSLPGDNLYGVKRFTEHVVLFLNSDDAELIKHYANRRITEIQDLLRLKREAHVMFSGVVELVTENIIIVEGLPVEVDSTATIDFEVRPQMEVIVDGRTTDDGQLLGENIRLLDSIALIPTPTDTPTIEPTIIPSDTPQPTATETALPSETPIAPTIMPSSTYTARLTVTQVTRPSATATATPQLRNTEVIEPTSTIQRTNTPRPTQTDGSDCIATPPDGWIPYRIQPNDTLSDLAITTDSTQRDVMDANCLSDARLIIVDTIIYLPQEPVRSATEAPIRSSRDSNTDPIVSEPTDSRTPETTSSDPVRDTRTTNSDSDVSASRASDSNNTEPTATPNRRD